MNKEFEKLLEKEAEILDQISSKQIEMRNAVKEKNWNNLMALITDVNVLSDSFKTLDASRDKIQTEMQRDELSSYKNSLSDLRSKLLKCKAENKAFASYVNISRSFVQQVVERALPQSRNKNYSRNGNIVQPQPQSVVVNQLF